ncbi:TRY1 protein, partial [Columbina picui]|nr:TRY1 protein [Columbina picui]
RLGGQRRADGRRTEQWRRSAKVVPYPRYEAATKDGDLMLVKLQVPVRVTKSVEPLPLATECPAPGSVCKISGWGSTTSPEGT